jgi:2-desacetyl-2-hydroxyethyl bacteriochlorophyllide A dehydrogenase
MRAALLEAAEKPLLVVDDVDIDEPRVGEVLTRVTNCGVCHSDLLPWEGTIPFMGTAVLGHEAAGVVERVGPGVTQVKPGDKVVLTPVPSCNHCYWCLRGEYGCCINAAMLSTGTLLDGHSPLSRHGQSVQRGVGLGGFAEYVITPESGAVKVDDDTPLDIACVIGCAVQTGVGAVLNTAKVEVGANVLVLGAGGIGISIVQGARLAAAEKIIVVDTNPDRLEQSKSFGATDVIDPGEHDVVSTVMQLTSGIGVDYAFDAVGRAALVQTGLTAIRNGGTTVMVGVGPLDEVISIPMPAFYTLTERKLIGCLLGSSNGRRDIPRLLGLYRAGRLDLENMITSRRPLAEVNDAYADMVAGRGLRTVLTI